VWQADGLLVIAGNNLFKHAPALGRALARAALGDGLAPNLPPQAKLGADILTASRGRPAGWTRGLHSDPPPHRRQVRVRQGLLVTTPRGSLAIVEEGMAAAESAQPPEPAYDAGPA
jgi:hypothetical protein